MTPFGEKLRTLRADKGMSQAVLAAELEVSAAYLSALEHGKKGAPPRRIVLKVIQIFGLIWDDAEELEQLAEESRARVTIDTTSLSPKATKLANRFSRKILQMSDDEIDAFLKQLDHK